MPTKSLRLIGIIVAIVVCKSAFADPRLRSHLIFLRDTLIQMETNPPDSVTDAIAVDITKIPELKLTIERELANLEAGREPSHLDSYYEFLPSFLQRKFRDRLQAFTPALPGTRKNLVTREVFTFSLSRLGLTPYASEAEVRERIAKLDSLGAIGRNEDRQRLFDQAMAQIREFQKAASSPDQAEQHIKNQVAGWDSNASHLMFKINIDFKRGMVWPAKSFDKFADFLIAMAQNNAFHSGSVTDAHAMSLFSLPSRLLKLAYRIGNDATDAEAAAIREKIYRANREYCLTALEYVAPKFNRGYKWDPPAWLIGMSILTSTTSTIEDTIARIKSNPNASKHLLDGLVFTFETLGETQVNLYSHEGTAMIEKLFQMVEQDKISVSWGKNRLLSYMLNKLLSHHSSIDLTPQVIDHPNLTRRFESIRQHYREAAELGGAATGLVGFFTCPQLQSARNRVKNTCDPSSCYVKSDLSIGNFRLSSLQSAEAIVKWNKK
jgi:hypothetical protein